MPRPGPILRSGSVFVLLPGGPPCQEDRGSARCRDQCHTLLLPDGVRHTADDLLQVRSVSSLWGSLAPEEVPRALCWFGLLKHYDTNESLWAVI